MDSLWTGGGRAGAQCGVVVSPWQIGHKSEYATDVQSCFVLCWHFPQKRWRQDQNQTVFVNSDYSFTVVRCGSSSLRRGTLQTPRHLKAGEGIPRSSLARFRSPPRRIMPHRIQSRNRLPCPRVIEGHVELNAGCFGRTQQSQTSGWTHVQDAYVPTGCAGELRSRLLDTILHCDVPGDRWIEGLENRRAHSWGGV